MENTDKRFVKLNDKVYYEDEVRSMTIDELNQLSKQCTAALQEIAIKKSEYRMSNKEPQNSKKFWSQMNAYKIASIRIQQSMSWINEVKKSKNISARADREHWLFCFYSFAHSILPKFVFNKIKDLTVKKVQYEIEF